MSAASVRARAKRVKLVVFDVDGVLTDGGLYYGPTGEMMKRFNVKDGHGMVMARLSKLPVAVLTARTSEMVAVRAKELRLTRVYQGRREKGPALIELCAELGLAPSDCAYMGDDTNDVAPLKLAGLAACPADAVAEARSHAHWVSKASGGHGAARELLELILKGQGRWADVMAQLGA